MMREAILRQQAGPGGDDIRLDIGSTRMTPSEFARAPYAVLRRLVGDGDGARLEARGAYLSFTEAARAAWLAAGSELAAGGWSPGPVAGTWIGTGRYDGFTIEAVGVADEPRPLDGRNVAPPPLTMTLAELAAVFHRTVDSFRNLRPRLERAGFPRRIPGTNLWSRAAVEAWLAGAGTGGQPAGPDVPAPDALAAAREALERIYGAPSS